MGSAQMALDRRPLCQTGKRGKNCPKPSWQALTPPGNVVKKVPQTILANLYPLPLMENAHKWKQHISKRGFPNLELGILTPGRCTSLLSQVSPTLALDLFLLGGPTRNNLV